MDWFDDFDNDDSFEDEYDADTNMDDPLDADTEPGEDPDESESQEDDFTARDAFFLGAAMGFAYEEGLKKRKRRKRKRFRDDSD